MGGGARVKKKTSGGYEDEEPSTDGRRGAGKMAAWRRDVVYGGKGKINGERWGNDRLTRAAEGKRYGVGKSGRD